MNELDPLWVVYALTLLLVMLGGWSAGKVSKWLRRRRIDRAWHEIQKANRR